jgi:glutamyl-tRNA synthetase
LGESGNKKLGKRDGAKDVLDYIRDGFLPEALVSFIATLGWNDGSTQEVFTVKELIEKFSLDRVQRSGARFDDRRLLWTNGHFIREMSLDELYKKVDGFWPKSASTHDTNYKKQVLGAVQERLKHFSELPELTEFFFDKPEFKLELIDDDKKLRKVDIKELAGLLKTSVDTLEESDFSVDDLRERFDKLLTSTGQKPAILLGIIRLAVSRTASSPNLSQTLNVLGKEESISRIKEVMVELNG